MDLNRWCFAVAVMAFLCGCTRGDDLEDDRPAPNLIRPTGSGSAFDLGSSPSLSGQTRVVSKFSPGSGLQVEIVDICKASGGTVTCWKPDGSLNPALSLRINELRQQHGDRDPAYQLVVRSDQDRIALVKSTLKEQDRSRYKVQVNQLTPQEFGHGLVPSGEPEGSDSIVNYKFALVGAEGVSVLIFESMGKETWYDLSVGGVLRVNGEKYTLSSVAAMESGKGTLATFERTGPSTEARSFRFSVFDRKKQPIEWVDANSRPVSPAQAQQLREMKGNGPVYGSFFRTDGTFAQRGRTMTLRSNVSKKDIGWIKIKVQKLTSVHFAGFASDPTSQKGPAQ